MSRTREAGIDESLTQRAGEQVTAVVRLPEPDLTQQSVSARAETLRNNAAKTQKAVTDFVRGRGGTNVKRQLWITNAIVLDVDTGKTPLEEIARIPEVTRIHENFEVNILEPEESVQSDSSGDEVETSDHGSYTYGLEQINVPQVWSDLGTKGGGARVAVLDTGIEPSHPDLDLAAGGWAEFDEYGSQIDSEPYDDGDHGTHVSGTVSGGAQSGEHIGVAPNVELYHGLVLKDGTGSFAQITAGIEWAVNNNCDVINMSLGAQGYYPSFIDPLENAISAGVIPVCSSGNDGETTSGSPGNVYGESIAVGASDSNEDIASFSSGETVDTDVDWGSDAPSDWPSKYIVPDVAAPGYGVKSSLPGGGYGNKYGTSMASPHVAGVAALIVSVTDGNITPAEIWDTLESTAWKPDSWDPSNANNDIEGKDTRYGTGIIDAKAACDQFAFDLSVTADDITTSGGNSQISLDGAGLSKITIQDLWLDWNKESVQADGASTTDNIATDGTFTFDWGSEQSSVSPSLTISPPTDYIGGTYEITVTGESSSDTILVADTFQMNF